MKLSNDIIKQIVQEYENFKDYMYATSPKETRDRLGQFFTPASVTLEMISKLPADAFTGNVLDPTSGSGNLLAACLIAGADSNRIYGNDCDSIMVKACRERLNKVCDLLGKPRINDWQIHCGDATDSFCLTYFGPDYKQKLEEHYLGDQHSLFPMLTTEQEEFLKGVD